MRQPAALGVGLLTWLLAGCVGGAPSASGGRLWRGQSAPVPAGPDVVRMEVALLECPLGDAYINHDLWADVDEQVIAPEDQPALEANGFRVGQIGGLIPAGLQELLVSKRSNANPRQLVVPAGRPAAVNLGPTVPRCCFRLVRSGGPTEVRLEQARCQLVVTPTAAADGQIRLHFTPQVEHGERVPRFEPAPDGSGFVMEVERPHKSYPALAWDVTLAPNQYVLVGTRFENPGSLGFAGLVQADGTTDVQRLLVIRTSRPGAPAAADGDDLCSRRSPPLALQAQLQGSGIRDQGSGIRDQGSGIRKKRFPPAFPDP